LKYSFLILVAMAVFDVRAGGGSPGLCTAEWYRFVDQKLVSGDGQGHGPDLGSDEWKGVIEFKLGVRDQPDLPGRDTDAWCERIDGLLREQGKTAGESENPDAGAGQPSYACDSVDVGSIEALICNDSQLSALDRELAGVYSIALEKAANQHPPTLKAEQRGWIKGRNECWKSIDRRACVEEEYRRRIAALQAWYRLVDASGPVRFACEGNPANEVVVTFFRTEPPTLIAERGDSVSLMYRQRSASGTRYRGRNESFWEHQGEARITWGHGTPEMQCVKAR